MCVRGASALGQLLKKKPNKEAMLFVVWEPIVEADVGPPPGDVLALLDDPRTIQFWDANRLLSAQMVHDLRAHPDWLRPGDQVIDGHVVWDFVAVYDPGATWQSETPRPIYYSNPLVAGIAELQRLIGD